MPSYLSNKIEPKKESWPKGVLIPKLFNNQLASCALINLDFLMTETVQFSETIIFPFFVSLTFGFLFSAVLLHFKQSDKNVL